MIHSSLSVMFGLLISLPIANSQETGDCFTVPLIGTNCNHVCGIRGLGFTHSFLGCNFYYDPDGYEGSQTDEARVAQESRALRCPKLDEFRYFCPLPNSWDEICNIMCDVPAAITEPSTSTTEAPTSTLAPTTTSPTSALPTTVVPTTKEPTRLPTTTPSTLLVPLASTTSSPTSALPTTVAPTTKEPTRLPTTTPSTVLVPEPTLSSTIPPTQDSTLPTKNPAEHPTMSLSSSLDSGSGHFSPATFSTLGPTGDSSPKAPTSRQSFTEGSVALTVTDFLIISSACLSFLKTFVGAGSYSCWMVFIAWLELFTSMLALALFVLNAYQDPQNDLKNDLRSFAIFIMAFTIAALTEVADVATTERTVRAHRRVKQQSELVLLGKLEKAVRWNHGKTVAFTIVSGSVLAVASFGLSGWSVEHFGPTTFTDTTVNLLLILMALYMVMNIACSAGPMVFCPNFFRTKLCATCGIVLIGWAVFGLWVRLLIIASPREAGAMCFLMVTMLPQGIEATGEEIRRQMWTAFGSADLDELQGMSRKEILQWFDKQTVRDMTGLDLDYEGDVGDVEMMQ